MSDPQITNLIALTRSCMPLFKSLILGFAGKLGGWLRWYVIITEFVVYVERIFTWIFTGKLVVTSGGKTLQQRFRQLSS